MAGDQTTTVAELRQLLRDFVDERQWQRFHDAKNLSMALAVEAAELMEHFQWTQNTELTDHLADPQTRAEVRDEVADVMCFLLALSNALDLDLADAVRSKMAKNVAKYPADEFRGIYRKPRKSEPPPPGA